MQIDPGRPVEQSSSCLNDRKCVYLISHYERATIYRVRQKSGIQPIL